VQAIEHFLKEIEQRAFRMAMLATRSEADALDIVQDAMIKLVNKYSDKPSNELKPLFLRILENSILDWHRKEKLKNKLFFWRKDESKHESPDEEHYERVIDESSDPLSLLDSEKLGEHLLKTIEQLPVKQQQCFLLRSWEGLSVRETAEIMNINENSVKSHYFRAMDKLRTTQTTWSE
jgi:RNA polymerase sigma-70 factor (ECF subfamily)